MTFIEQVSLIGYSNGTGSFEVGRNLIGFTNILRNMSIPRLDITEILLNSR